MIPQEYPLSDGAGTPQEYSLDVPGGASIAARSAGYDWSDINDHVAQASDAAQQAGYEPIDIDQYLGFKDPWEFAQRATGTWASNFAMNPDLLAQLQNPQQPFDMTQDPNLARNYADAMKAGEVKNPQDFADRYAAAAVEQTGLQEGETPKDLYKRRLQAAASGSAQLGQLLPSRSDTTDAALSLVLDPTQVWPTMGNMLDHWAETGQHPISAAIQAQNDPGLFQKLVGGKDADPEPQMTGDPEAQAAVAASKAIEPAVTAHLEGVAHDFDEWAKQEDKRWADTPGVTNLEKMRAAAKDPRGLETSMAIGLGFTPLPLEGRMKLFNDIVGKVTGITRNEQNQVVGFTREPVPVETPEAKGTPEHIVPQPVGEVIAPPEPIPQARLEKTGEHDVPSYDDPEKGVKLETHNIINDAGEKIGEAEITRDPEKPGVAHVDTIHVGEGYFEKPSGDLAGANQVGPRQMRELARQYFTENPSVDTIEGLRVTGARSKTGERQVTVTRDQVMGPGKRFDETVQPYEKIETLAREAGEHNGDPHFFEKLVEGEDTKTAALAKSWDSVAGMWKMFKDVMADESGALRLFRGSAAAKLARDTKNENYNIATNLIRRMQGRIEDWPSHFEAENSVHRLINGQMSEYNAAIKAGGNGLGTQVGDMIARMAGFGRTAINRSSAYWPVIDHTYDISRRLARRMQQGIRDGLFTEDQLRRRLVTKMFGDTGAVLNHLDNGGFATAVSHPRTIHYEGLQHGFTPVETHPLMFQDLLTNHIARTIEQARGLEWARSVGAVYVDRAPAPGSRDVRLNGWAARPNSNEMAAAKAAWQAANPMVAPKNFNPLAYHLYADPMFDRLWDRYLEGHGMENPEGKLATFTRKLQYWANQTILARLALPFYHAGTILKESYTGHWAYLGDLMADRNWLQFAKEVGFTPFPLPRQLYAWQQATKAYYRGVASPEIRALIDVGGFQRRRPDIYKSVSERAPTIWDSMRKGSLMQELRADINSLWPDNGQSPMTKGLLAPIRSAEMLAKEVGRIYTSIPGLNQFWENFIPAAKGGTNILRVREALHANPTQTPLERANMIRKIVDDTDNRMGEMNQDNIMWPHWVKNILNTLMISAVSWKYGTMRLIGGAFGLNTDKLFAGLGRHSFEWNPYATRSLIAMLFSNALINSTVQRLFTGTFPTPWDDRPFEQKIKQALTPWFGGILAKGAQELVMVPGQEKEFLDWAKIWLGGIHGGQQHGVAGALLEFAKAMGDYGFAGMKPIFSLWKDLYTGKDAIGNDIKLQTGGLSRYLSNQFLPLQFGSMADRKIGTAVPQSGTLLGLRPAGTWWNDPQNYWKGRDFQDKKTQKDQIARERREIKQLETPPDWAQELPADKGKGPKGKSAASNGGFQSLRGGSGVGLDDAVVLNGRTPSSVSPTIATDQGSRAGRNARTITDLGTGGGIIRGANRPQRAPRQSNSQLFDRLRGPRQRRFGSQRGRHGTFLP